MPDTTSYLILGMAVIGAILGLYVLSIAIRIRSADKDIDLLRSLQEE